MRTLTMTAIILCIASASFGEVAFSDDDFNDADWTTKIFRYMNPTDAISSIQVEVGGNPGAFRKITLYSSPDDWYDPCRALLIDIKLDAVYDPTILGPINFVSYGEDHKCSTSDNCHYGGVRWFPAILQDGKYFMYVNPDSTGVLESWTTATVDYLYETDFGEVNLGDTTWSDPSSNPDFSATGASMQFGYGRANSRTGLRSSLIDNWTFAIDHLVVPNEMMSWGAIKSVYR